MTFAVRGTQVVCVMYPVSVAVYCVKDEINTLCQSGLSTRTELATSQIMAKKWRSAYGASCFHLYCVRKR
jgi:hypothetical protein